MPSNASGIETLSLNGRRVIPAREAARIAGWSQNYISILCRTGELSGLRLTAGWLVDETTLHGLIDKRARDKVRRREQLICKSLDLIGRY
jgi:hypothetical protein